MTAFTLRYLLLVASISLGCKSHTKILDSTSIFESANPVDSLKFYFPDILNTKAQNHPMYDNFEQNWFSSSLFSFKEPILKDKSANESIYRFLWLRSFDQPVCFTLKEHNNDYFLSTKTLDNTPAWYPKIEARYVNDKEVYDTVQRADRLAKIVFAETTQIDKSEWMEFESLLKEIKFWSLPSIDRSDGSTDGSEWVFEGLKDKKYHFVARHNSHELKKCGMFLIKLSNLKIEKDRIY